MAVSKKNKRKLVFLEKVYYWHVSPDYDRAELKRNFNILHIIAEDKSLELHLPLEKMDPEPETVSPGFVKRIIESICLFTNVHLMYCIWHLA